MKKIITSSLLILVLMLIGSGISFSQSKETRDVSGFREVSFGISGNLYITIGPSFKVTLEGDGDYLKEIETVVKDGKLQIRKDNYRFFNNEKADIYITLPELSGLGLSGSGKAKVESVVKTDKLNLSVSGSGRIYTGSINVSELKCGISGSGDIIIEGSGEARTGNISISGSGNYNGPDLRIANLSIGVSGSGKCDCYVTEVLTSRISGSGDVSYSGSPKIDSHSSGSGHLRSK